KPEDGYAGEYINELARAVGEASPGIYDLPADERRTAVRAKGYEIQLAEQQQSLARLQTEFDVWFSELSLHDGGAVPETLAQLKELGHVFEEGGALWMRTTDFGDDKDRVLIKS